MNTKMKKILLVPAAAALLLALAVSGCAAGAGSAGTAATTGGTDDGAGTSVNDAAGGSTAVSAGGEADGSTAVSDSGTGDSTAVSTGTGDFADASSDGGQAAEIIYKNTQYGFNFTLPESWNGYTIVTDTWEGVTNDKQGQTVTQTGPEILIRHPLWTETDPRQDIPILVFTLDQWDALQNDEFHIGAAPIGPRELGRNSKYVFALPARYNFAFLTGYEEVETILDNNPLQPTENFSD